MAEPAATDGLRLRHRAERLSGRLPALMVAAERVASTVMQGVHGRRRVGIGETFWQYRRYEAGDPAELIDWRQSARSDKLFVRENEWEAAQSVWLWRDASPSMHWRSGSRLDEKADRASLLLLALAVLLVRGGERIGLLDSDRNPLSGRIALERIAGVLAAPPDGPQAGLPPRRELPRFSAVVLVGDFLSPAEAVRDTVERLAAQGAGGLVVQIADPAEEDLPFNGRMRFQGPEGEGELTIGRVEALRQPYRDLVAARREALEDVCRRAGWQAIWHRTDRPPETALLAAYRALAERRD